MADSKAMRAPQHHFRPNPRDARRIVRCDFEGTNKYKKTASERTQSNIKVALKENLKQSIAM